MAAKVAIKDPAEIMNRIAGKVVLVEADDIQGLGEILQLINDLNVPDLRDFIDHTRTILEKMILDEYESAKVGLEHLNDAVEQLQLSFQSMGQLSKSEMKAKEERIAREEAKPSTIGNGTAVIDMAGETPAYVKDIPKPEAKTQPAKEAVPAAEAPKPQSAPEPKAPQVKAEPPSPPAKTDKPVYFKERDNPALIEATIKEDPELVQGFIDESSEQLLLIENGLISWEESPEDLSVIDNVFRPFHTIKGVSGFLNLADINGFAHIYEDLLDDARKGKIVYNEALAEVVFAGIDALKTMITAVSRSLQEGKYKGHSVDLNRFASMIAAAREGKSTGAVPREIEKEKIKPATAKPVKKEKEELAAYDFGDAENQADGDRKNAGRSLNKTDSSVKVATSKMDNLIDLVGELVVTQNMVVQNEVVRSSHDKRLQRDIGQLKRITGSLQDLSMSLRMVPIKETFQRMHRIVRDISRKSGKKIVLETYGEDTELDRNMVEELYEPLVHMIRNNCDHGIEMPDVRKKSGKSETGTVTLSAFYKGGMVYIEVVDDGKGIDKNVILNKAIEKGLCSPSDKLSESEILNFIFAPGFSTSSVVTDISGRGVGMDVVRKAITKLRGSIEVKTAVNQGTTIQLRLPLTLAIIDGVIVRVGAERYIIPTLSIKESMMASAGTFNKIVGRGETIFIRGRIIPLLRLHEIFGIPGGIQDPKDGLLIIVESDGREAALLVDDMMDKQEIVIKSLGEGLNKIEGLAGGAIMSDGNIGLIIDIPTLLPKATSRLNS
jgi:two-component system chemotaxis sensor kinase CheA